MGLVSWLLGRRRQNIDLADAADSRVRVAQDMMEATLARVHSEMEVMREAHERALDEARAQVLELTMSLTECDRERVRLAIRLAQYEADS